MTIGLLLLTVMAGYLGMVSGKTSFVKDLRTDVVFPPGHVRVVQGIPEGHLRPLGWQKKPDGKVREEKEAVGASTFHLRYIKTVKPAVFRQALAGQSVLKTWEEDSYLKEKYGKINVTITVKKELQTRTDRRMLFRKFLLDYKYENWYLSSTIHSDMLAELPLPEMFSCGTYKDRLTEAELWMSSGGTASLLHSHGEHNIHCVVDGRKDFIVIDPKHKDTFEYKETYPNSGSGHSPWDMDMINMFKFPKIAKTPWTWSTLWPGDCIYIPAGYLHQVRSYGRGISYTVQAAPSVDFDATDCRGKGKSKRRKKDKKDAKIPEASDEEEKKLTLADVKFIWAYSEGKRHLSDKNLEPSSLRRILSLLLRDGDKLHQDVFMQFYEEALSEDPNKPPAMEIFHAMTPNDERTYISRAEISSLVASRLQSVCDVFNKMHQRVHDEL